MKTAIITDQAPLPIGPYSQAIITEGKLIFVSGQIPLKPDGTLPGDNISVQTRQSIENIKAILEKNNCTLENIVKTTVYMTDMSDFPKMNEVYNEYFSTSKPARAAVEVSRLPKDVLVEIEAIAVY